MKVVFGEKEVPEAVKALYLNAYLPVVSGREKEIWPRTERADVPSGVKTDLTEVPEESVQDPEVKFPFILMARAGT